MILAATGTCLINKTLLMLTDSFPIFFLSNLIMKSGYGFVCSISISVFDQTGPKRGSEEPAENRSIFNVKPILNQALTIQIDVVDSINIPQMRLA